MNRIALLLLLLCSSFSSAQEAKAKPVKQFHEVAPPIHSANGVICSPWSKDHVKYPRGMTKTPRYKLASAHRFDPAGIKALSQVAMLPPKLSMWDNDVDGDCVSASEAARIAGYSVYCGLPEVFIPDANLIAWARRGGYLNGANLTDVMSDRQTRGMADANGKLYLAGPYSSVDFTNEATLQAALSVGPVNFGIDANALPSAAGNNQGWYAFGGSPGSFNNEDHCTPSMGFVAAAGSVQQAFALISKVYNVTITPPANAPSGPVYFWFTWSTIGVVDHKWIMSTAGEALVQNPTTVGQVPGPPIPPDPPTPPGPVVTITLDLTANQAASLLKQLGGGTPTPTTMTGTLKMNTDGSWTFTPITHKAEPKKTSCLTEEGATRIIAAEFDRRWPIIEAKLLEVRRLELQLASNP